LFGDVLRLLVFAQLPLLNCGRKGDPQTRLAASLGHRHKLIGTYVPVLNDGLGAPGSDGSPEPGSQLVC
jgi:hypothetical protein